MEKYNLEKARAEAEKLAQKVKSGEASSYADAEKKLDDLESELSPEAIEKIMEKVRDIYAYGTAYTSIPGEKQDNEEGKLESILRNGLIGKDWTNKDKRRKPISPEQWRKDVRERLNPVHFNIVGRTLAYNYLDQGKKYIDETLKEFREETEPGKAGKPFPRMRGINNVWRPPYIVFDISSFRELDTLFNEDNQKGSSRTYRINAPQDEVDTTPDSDNKMGVGAEFGFQLHHRLPPRLITGVVVYNDNPAEIEKIVETMKTVFSDPKKMIPIYSLEGSRGLWPPNVKSGAMRTMNEYEEFLKKSATFSLVWPKQMSYEEVQNFIAERDKQKIEKESDVI